MLDKSLPKRIAELRRDRDHLDSLIHSLERQHREEVYRKISPYVKEKDPGAPWANPTPRFRDTTPDPDTNFQKAMKNYVRNS